MRTILIALFASLTILSYDGLDAYQAPLADAEGSHEVLYLPNGQGLDFLSFGYRNVLADLLWFKTISYFGKHFRSDHTYRWLSHMCGLVTDLNPLAEHVYEFCSLMPAWEADDSAGANELLGRGIAHFPEKWFLYYLRGFNYMYFLDDQLRAQADFVAAAKLPQAPPFLARLAAKKLADLDNPQEAAEFLSNMIANSPDPSQRAALEIRLKDVLMEGQFRVLEQALEVFKSRFGRAPEDLSELVTANILTALTPDPFGGNYFIDSADGRIKSTTPRKRLRDYRKKTFSSSEHPRP